MIRKLLGNLGWKLLALGLAVLLWLAFASAPDVVTSVATPLEFQHMPAGLEIVSSLPERIHLQVQGPPGKLESANLASIVVVLDLSGVQGPCQRTFTIDQHETRLPLGVRLVRAVPGQLRLEFERRTTTQVPVRVRFSGRLPRAYQVRSFEAHPGKLTVVGPESRVAQVVSAETDPVELFPKPGTAEYRVNAFVREPQVRFAAPPLVRVRVVLESSGAGP
ncbi:MAG: YbbR-like domain-containing protein [Acidobacteria bacterium]|nr:YbbR-like domain-containing protein [Acidobacteriota bacterium]